MYKIEADIKKKTINTFVEMIKELPYLSQNNIEMLASVTCDMIDKEVEKEVEKERKELDDIF